MLSFKPFSIRRELDSVYEDSLCKCWATTGGGRFGTVIFSPQKRTEGPVYGGFGDAEGAKSARLKARTATDRLREHGAAFAVMTKRGPAECGGRD